jgi:DNA-binding IclR family transcriptional regulator
MNQGGLKMKNSDVAIGESTIKTLDRAIYVLDQLRVAKVPLGVNEMSKLCNLNLSTVFRIMKTLASTGWVHQLSDGKYIMGQIFFFQTEKDNLYLALKDVAYPTMCRLTAQEYQAMNLCVRINEKCIILQQSRTDRLIDFVPPQGTSLPVHASGSGKVLFSELDQPFLDDILELIDFKKLAPRTIITRQMFLQELVKVRDEGYGLDFHESLESTSCVAVPIRNPNGDIIAALSFSGFIGLGEKAHLIGYVPSLHQAAEEISEKLFKTFKYKPIPNMLDNI